MIKEKILLPHQYYYPHMDLLADKSSLSKEKNFFAELNIKSGKNKEGSVYIHIPFCDSKCAFCGFDKVKNTNEILKYKEKVIEEIENYAKTKYIQDLKINVIHMGGGTPTILPKEVFNSIIAAIKNNFNVSNDVIINIEGSATTIYKDEVIEYIKENNISKVSVGVQTFYQKLREQYKCKATLEEVYLTLSKLKSNNITTGIDIMYGFPDFKIGDLKEITFNDIKEAIRLDVDAIDFGQMYPYCNSLEKRVSDENLSFLNKNDLIDVITTVNKMMYDSGYEQKASYGYTKKNKDILVMESAYYGGINNVPDCIAIGSGAFGFINGYKYRNNSYNAYMNDGKTRYSQLKKLTDVQLENLNILGFPKLLYLTKEQLKYNNGQKYKDKLKTFINEGLLEENEYYYKVTEKGKCFIDNMYYFLLEDEEREKVDKQIKKLVIR